MYVQYKTTKPGNAPYSQERTSSRGHASDHIGIHTGNYIQDGKSGIITYYRRIDMSRIAKILATGRFEEKVEVVIDNDKLGTTADPHGK